jgi:hypothetical protein
MRGKLVENLEEILIVALLSPACCLFIFIYLFILRAGLSCTVFPSGGVVVVVWSGCFGLSGLRVLSRN